MMESLLRYLRCWFVGEDGILSGRFAISGGSIEVPSVQDGQFIRIVGSLFNDGVVQWPAADLRDEEFDGEVWLLRVPREIVEICSEIEAWQQKNGAFAHSPYQRESFGGYSYTRAGGASTWQGAFRDRLSLWRKL